MRWLTQKLCAKTAIFIATGVLLPALCAAVDLKVPGLPGISLKYGTLERSREVTDIFQTLQILPGHTYYFSGWGTVPYAVIAIDSKFKLRKGLWQEIEATVPLLRNWVRQMDTVYGYPPYGSRILDHKGERLGVWYSSKQWTTIIIEEDNEIAVLAPEAPGFRGGK